MQEIRVNSLNAYPSELFPSRPFPLAAEPAVTAARSSTLAKLEALRSCVHACDLGAAFLSWASVLSRPPKAAAVPHRTNSDVRQSRRTTLRLLEALRLVVLHEPLGHAHHALRRWHELAKLPPRGSRHQRQSSHLNLLPAPGPPRRLTAGPPRRNAGARWQGPHTRVHARPAPASGAISATATACKEALPATEAAPTRQQLRADRRRVPWAGA